MSQLANSAEGGADGSAVTAANSGGASGSAWSAVSIPSGTSISFRLAAAYQGSLGYRFTPGSASGTGPFVRWKLGSGWSQLRTRFYLKVTANPSVSTQVAYVTDPAAAKVLSRVVLLSTGNLGVQDAAGTTLFQSGPVPLNSWVRVEWIVAPGTNSVNGTIRFGWATGESAIGSGNTYSSSAVNAGTGTVGLLYLGKLAGTWNATSYFDEIAADDTSSSAFVGAVTAASSGGSTPAPSPTPSPSAAATAWPPDPYRAVIRSGGFALTYTVDASLSGIGVAGATGLTPIDGTITDTTKAGVRRTLNVDFAPEPGLFDLLAPIGTTLTVTAHVVYPNGVVQDIPMGVFDVDSETLAEGGGKLSLTAPDKWQRIVRAKFIGPAQSTPSNTVVGQVVQWVQGALGAGEASNVLTSNLTLIGSQTFEKDRDKAITDALTSVGCWGFFDRTGVFTIADLPQIGASADWLIDSSPSGVLVTLARTRSRTSTHNVVIVESTSSGSTAPFPTTYAWDTDSTSATYAGPDPIAHPELTGPFGVSVYYYDTSTPLAPGQANTTAGTILATVVGLASQVTLTAVHNPAIDAFDVLDVLAPRERYDIPRVLERHIVDTVTHSLDVAQAQQIQGRSTRTDAYS